MADSRIPAPIGFDPTSWASFVAEVNAIFDSLYDDPRALQAEAHKIAVEVLGPDFDEEPYKRRQLDADLEARVSRMAEEVGRFSRLRQMIGIDAARSACISGKRGYIVDVPGQRLLKASGVVESDGWALVARYLSR